MKQSLGLIKWFDNEKGFGRIGTVDGADVFISINQFINKPEKVLKAKAVFFDVVEDKKGKKAINVSNPETYDHFKYLMSLKETNPKVKIEFTLKGESRWGNKYIRKEFRDSSVFDYAIYQLLRYKEVQDVTAFFCKHFKQSSFDGVESIKEIFQSTREILNKISFTTTEITAEGNKVNNEISNNIIIENVFDEYLLKIDEKYLYEIWSQKIHHAIKQNNNFFNTWHKEKFLFPEKMFLDNYKTISKELFYRILHQNDRKDICCQIILKKIEDYDEVNESNYTNIKSCIDVLTEDGSFSEFNSLLFTKNLDLFITSKSLLNDSGYFDQFLKFSGRNFSEYQKKQAIDAINQHLDEETIFKYWHQFKYFIASNDFIFKNLDKLTQSDFISAPSEFHNEYFRVEYKKINFDNSLLSFCNLLFLILEIPGSQLQQVEANLDKRFLSAFWLYNSYFNYDDFENFPQDYFNYDVSFSKSDLLEYLFEIDNLNEIIQITNIINEVYLIYRDQKTNSNSVYKFGKEEKTKIICELLKSSLHGLKLTEVTTLKLLLKRNESEKNVEIIKDFIPKFINLENNADFDQLLSLEEFFRNDNKYRYTYFNYLSELVSPSKKLILWQKDYSNNIDISAAIKFLKECQDNLQFRTLKKIFLSLHLNKHLINKDLYIQFQDLANSSSLNINVRISLYVLITLNSENQFISDKTIFDLVSERLNENVNELLKFDELLDKCIGRTWKALKFDGGGKERWFANIGGLNFPVNDNSISIKNRSYPLNRESKSIFIEGFYYNFKWVKKANIFHTENYGIPDGVTFCDAVKSQFDENLKTNFYWCCNSKCYSPCQTNYNPFQWENYTLRDFITILGIPFNNDLFYRFASVVNRTNRLLEKLKCNSCNKLMRDAATSEFAFYRVNTFHCTDPSCSEFHQKVYLTHCLNWKCLNVIDTRVSKACPNGWYICDKCDNCCSQEKIDKRYQNLLTNAAFNPDNLRHQKLKFQVVNKLGHLERNEIFNFTTGEKK